MTHEDDPRPLADPAGTAPTQLVRALQALGRQQPSAAALQASALRLEARLDAQALPATEPQLATGVRAVGGKLLGGRLLLAALAVGVGAGALVLRQSPARTPPPSAQRVEQVTPAPRIEVPQASTLPAHADERPHAAAEPEPAPAAPAAAIAQPGPAAWGAGRTASSHGERTRATSPAVRPKPAPSASTALPNALEASAPSAVTDEPSSATGRVAEQPKPSAPRSELQLLLAARKLARTDPAAALQVVAEHAHRFPHGVLAPEREVLAIEALRALGQSDQAEQRLRRFRASYPDSLHTPGLSQGAP